MENSSKRTLHLLGGPLAFLLLLLMPASVLDYPVRGSLGLLAMVNPMVGWIWAATALMALGSLVALVPSRADTRP